MSERSTTDRTLALRIVVVVLVVTLFAWSLALPAFTLSGEAWMGHEVARLGWLGPFNFAVPLVGWYSNALWPVASLVMVAGGPRFGPPSAALLFAIALIAALQTYSLVGSGLVMDRDTALGWSGSADQFIVGFAFAFMSGGQDVVRAQFESFGSGFYIWLIALVLGLVGSIACLLVSQRAPLSYPASLELREDRRSPRRESSAPPSRHVGDADELVARAERADDLGC